MYIYNKTYLIKHIVFRKRKTEDYKIAFFTLEVFEKI